MQDKTQKRWGKLGGSVVVSVALHLAVAVALLVNLPETVPEPESVPEEETVTVEIVPPPEETPQPEQALAETAPEQRQTAEAVEPPQPEEAPTEQQVAEASPQPEAPAQPETAASETLQPEPPPPEEQQPAAEQPAEEPPAAEEPPPEQQQAEEQAAEAEQADAVEAEQPTQEGEGQGEPSALRVLRPVFAFGEQDAGPREDTGGNAAEDSEIAEAEQQEEAPEPTKQSPDQPAETALAPEVADTPPAQPAPADIQLPEANMAGTTPEAGPATSEEAGDAILALPVETPVEEPKPDPAPTELAALEPPKEIKGVKKLFSQNASGDAAATTAMRDLPRDVRADQLCVTELREQLRHATPAYRPELLPSYRLTEGNVLNVNRAAFRADRQWYSLSFRCEVDRAVTKVVSFGFSVGEPIPRNEWRRRGFPDY